MKAAKAEQDRARVCGVLHDFVLQDLLLVRRSLLRAKASRSGQEIDEALAMLSGTVTKVRAMCRELRPPQSECSSLRTLLTGIQQFPAAPVVEASIDVEEQALDPALRELALGVVREGLINVIKHARARHVKVTVMAQEGGHLFIRVADDGVGFRPPRDLRHLEQADHFGLVGIIDQVRHHGGRTEVISVPGSGTTLTVTVPLQAHAYQVGGLAL